MKNIAGSLKLLSLRQRSWFAVIVSVAALCLTTLLLFGFILTRSITIVDNGNPINITTGKVYFDEILTEAGISLGTGDEVSVPLHTKVKHGEAYTITRAKKINLIADGGVTELFTCEPNVKAAFAAAGITLGAYDEVSPVLETEITDEMNVQIYRVEVENITVSEATAYKTRKIPSPDHNVGYSAVISAGKNGEARNSYKLIRRDGEEVSRELISSETISEPVDEVVKYGIYNTKVVAASAAELSYSKVLECSASAYDPYPDGGAGTGRTATGRPARYGVVAVDPRVIPLGSLLYIESADNGGSWSYGYAIAADTGGAIKGNKIDLCFNSRSECYQFGRRTAKVYILN